MKTKDMATTALMAALLCVLAPITIPVGPIPLSLATFAVYMAGAVLGAKRGIAAVALYLLIGMTGIPVFSGFTGGIQRLAGVTGGYLIGYLPCAWITALGVKPGETEPSHKWRLAAMMAARRLPAWVRRSKAALARRRPSVSFVALTMRPLAMH